MDAADDWKRLADHVVVRRRELGMTTRNALADVSGLSYRVLGDLERGTRSLSERTLSVLEEGLRWQPGSARAILRGGDPVPLEDTRAIGEYPPYTEPTLWMRALSDAYKVASELSGSGRLREGGQLTHALNELGRSLTAYSALARADHEEYASDPKRIPVRTDRSGSTVLGIALGKYMRELRERQLLTSQKVAQITGCSRADIRLFELGRASLAGDEIRRLLAVYGVDDEQVVTECIELAEEAAQSGWWTRYNDILPRWFKSYLNLERCARSIRSYESEFIPGLLQTEEYARAIMDVPDGRDLERKVALRMQRQQILEVPHRVHLWAAVDESALIWGHESVSAEVMHDQIAHLIEMNSRNNIVLQIIPMKHSSRSPLSSFSLLRFDEPEVPDVVYIEESDSALYVDKKSDVERYKKLIDGLFIKGMSPQASAELLLDIRGRAVRNMMTERMDRLA